LRRLQARLPKGIRNIRPHIDDVDNVPLLVSLFTDCTPDSQFTQSLGGLFFTVDLIKPVSHGRPQKVSSISVKFGMEVEVSE